MKLSQLASKPQLVKVTLDDEATLAEYKEAVEFWTFDRQPLEIFMKLASSAQGNQGDVLDIVRRLILDEKGKQIVDDENMLPSALLIRAISKITDALGK